MLILSPGVEGIKATSSYTNPTEGTVADIEDRLGHALQWPKKWTYKSQKFSKEIDSTINRFFVLS